MDERNTADRERRDQRDLEERLSAYYGPALREQPLPASSWLQLRSRLGPQCSSGRWPVRRWWRFRRRTTRRAVPAYVRSAFSHIAYQSGVSYAWSLLHCTVNVRVRVPFVRVSPWGRHTIRLNLPGDLEQRMGQAELDVLLATGLARSLDMRKRAYTLRSLFFNSVMLLACVILVLLWWNRLPFMLILIAIMLYSVLNAGVLWLWHIEGRSVSVRADNVIVQWLGRDYVCQGLHALANRSRSPSRREWGELSLTERIGRVCGTQVTIENERLTLVR